MNGFIFPHDRRAIRWAKVLCFFVLVVASLLRRGKKICGL